MSITLADRRRLIVEEDATSEVVKKVYPWLFEDEEVLYEYVFVDIIYYTVVCVKVKFNLVVSKVMDI